VIFPAIKTLLKADVRYIQNRHMPEGCSGDVGILKIIWPIMQSDIDNEGVTERYY
jgi:hypothetical protein